MDTKYYLIFSDNETIDGKKKARPYQRQPEPLEKPHPPAYRQRCKSLYTFRDAEKPLSDILKSR